MKQKDIALIIAVVFISGVVSFVLSNFLFTSSKHRQEQVPVIEAITAEFKQPDQRYFNDKSFDPTRLIRINKSSNKKPFNAKEAN